MIILSQEDSFSSFALRSLSALCISTFGRISFSFSIVTCDLIIARFVASSAGFICMSPCFNIVVAWNFGFWFLYTTSIHTFSLNTSGSIPSVFFTMYHLSFFVSLASCNFSKIFFLLEVILFLLIFLTGSTIVQSFSLLDSFCCCLTLSFNNWRVESVLSQSFLDSRSLPSSVWVCFLIHLLML